MLFRYLCHCVLFHHITPLMLIGLNVHVLPHFCVFIKHSVRAARSTHRISITKTTFSVLFRETVIVWEIRGPV